LSSDINPTSISRRTNKARTVEYISGDNGKYEPRGLTMPEAPEGTIQVSSNDTNGRQKAGKASRKPTRQRMMTDGRP